MTTDTKAKLIIMSFLWIIIVLFTQFKFNNSTDGYKVGQIVKVSYQGVFHKTCEGELIKGGLINASTGGFYFTINSPKLCSRAIRFMKENKEVLIHYDKPFFYTRYSSESGAFVDDMKL